MRNIKKYYKLHLLALLFLGTASCEQFVDEVPVSTVSSDNFWRNSSDANAGVIAIYDGLQATYSQNYHFWGELRSDNFDLANSNSTNVQSELILNNLIQTSRTADWSRIYNTISRANIAIARLPELLDRGQATNSLLAEAYAIRAKLYFDAVRVWGDVPLITDGSSALNLDDLRQPRTPVSDVFDRIILDMTEADRLMEINSDPFRFSKSSIFCLQAEVYMWLKDYTSAKTSIENLIGLGTHSLATSVEDYNNMFVNETPGEGGVKQFGPELIYSIPYSISEQATDIIFDEMRNFGGGPFANNANRSGIKNTFNAGGTQSLISIDAERDWTTRFPIDSTTWTNLYPNTPPVLSTVEQVEQPDGSFIEETVPVYGDWRYFSAREDFTDVGEFGNQRLIKHGAAIGTLQSDDTDINVYRYSDMLLLLAEAENMLGNTTGSLNILNQIRSARLLPPINMVVFGASLNDREDFILEERRYELFGEGKRWWDLTRTNKVNENVDSKLSELMDITPRLFETPAGDDNTTRIRGLELFPININQLRDNNLLTQNPAYQ